MSLAQSEQHKLEILEPTSTTVATLSQRMATTSLDMNPSAEDAYEQAVMAYASSSSPNSSMTISSGSVVSSDNHQEFLRLLARFHQTVTPLPKSIHKSFGRSTTPPRGQISSGHASDDVTDTKDQGSSSPAPGSKMAYVPSRSYCKPASSPARRRTSSAPSPAASLVRKMSAPPVFNDMESLIKTADEMVHLMRTDMEEVMKRSRRKDRESREAGQKMDVDSEVATKDGKFVDMDDEAPLLRKVPARQDSWFTPPGFKAIQDPQMSATQHVASRPTITPRRLRCRLSGGNNLATIPEVSEPGEPLAPDAIDNCASKLTSLKIEDPPKPPPHTYITMAAYNPIRLYVGYSKPAQRPPFIFGTDVVSTQNSFEIAM